MRISFFYFWNEHFIRHTIENWMRGYFLSILGSRWSLDSREFLALSLITFHFYFELSNSISPELISVIYSSTFPVSDRFALPELNQQINFRYNFPYFSFIHLFPFLLIITINHSINGVWFFWCVISIFSHHSHLRTFFILLEFIWKIYV